MKTKEYMAFQRMISNAKSKEELIKIGMRLKPIQNDGDKQSLAELFGTRMLELEHIKNSH